ncbi:hypothetical protein Back2_03740 [Nocardioides baekrokdamisoli]|uniref:Bacterial spore germination immunoglobulin-like domain-containing protein n=1 Tax=Nocardioides baekrokdamisoli TaxID=1804624 RepID=A0A3G9IBA6_9ACTN|nr:Gmad2 immunoglobulin-like domain-containing protein [Nocardioides baekrokdamisoli]BBH16087.1 hypothetical protein Back2_03740 [Nocardioides baekrokdamisoli]
MRTLPALIALGLALTGCGTTTAAVSGTPTNSSTPIPTVSIDTTPVSARSSVGQVVLTLSQPYGNTHATTSFAVVGTSNSVEANTPWALTNAAHKVVRQGAFTADGWGDKLYPYSGTVSVAGLPAGTYLFTVRIDDPSDGEGKPVPQVSRVVLVG